MSNTVKRPDFKAKYDNYIGGQIYRSNQRKLF